MMNIKDNLKWAKELLESTETEGPQASAEFLLRQVLGCDRAYLFTYPEKKLTHLQELKYRRWVKKRSKHEPVWYITGKIEFMDLDMHVNTSVLIPRPETELMIEKIIHEVTSKKGGIQSILDVGTGSGTIILALAKSLSTRNPELTKGPGLDYSCGQNDVRFYASDVSDKALTVARKNAKTNSLSDLVEFRAGDLLSPWLGQKFDLIVANLPYVPHEDMATLAFDLTHYEPRLALDGGVLGLEVYKRFIQELPELLNPGALVYLEIGYDQGRYIEDFVHMYLSKAKVEVQGDYQQIDRIVVIST